VQHQVNTRQIQTLTDGTRVVRSSYSVIASVPLFVFSDGKHTQAFSTQTGIQQIIPAEGIWPWKGLYCEQTPCKLEFGKVVPVVEVSISARAFILIMFWLHQVHVRVRSFSSTTIMLTECELMVETVKIYIW